jgi:hypothetical protein
MDMAVGGYTHGGSGAARLRVGGGQRSSSAGGVGGSSSSQEDICLVFSLTLENVASNDAAIIMCEAAEVIAAMREH